MILVGRVSLEDLGSECRRVLGLVDDLEKEPSCNMHQQQDTSTTACITSERKPKRGLVGVLRFAKHA